MEPSQLTGKPEEPFRHWSDPFYRHRYLAFSLLITFMVCGIASAIMDSIHYTLLGQILTLIFLPAFSALAVSLSAAGESRWFAYNAFLIRKGAAIPRGYK